MYEIVNEPNLTIAFDMDTELSPFGVFGIYILNRAIIFVLDILILVIGQGFMLVTKH